MLTSVSTATMEFRGELRAESRSHQSLACSLTPQPYLFFYLLGRKKQIFTSYSDSHCSVGQDSNDPFLVDKHYE